MDDPDKGQLKLKMYRGLRWVILCWVMMFYSLIIGNLAPTHHLPSTILPVIIIIGLAFVIDKTHNLILFDLIQIVQAALFIYVYQYFARGEAYLFLTTGMTVLFMESLVLKPKWPQIPTLTILYCGYVISTGRNLLTTLLLIQTLTIWALLVIIAYRILYKRYAQVEELRKWNLRLSQANQRIAELTEEKVLRANAQDLHDTLTQDVIGINMYLTMVQKLADQHQYRQMQDMLTKTQQLTTAAVKRSRKMIEGYRTKTSSSAKQSLKQALSGIIDNLQSLYGLSTTLTIPTDILIKRSELHDIQSVVHEALMNVIKHGHTKQAIVNVKTTDQQLTIEVIDYGHSWGLRIRQGHYGITDMKERTARHNGKVTFSDTQPSGVKVTATFQIKEE